MSSSSQSISGSMAKNMEFVLGKVYKSPDETQEELMEGCRRYLQLLEDAATEKPDSEAKIKFDDVKKVLSNAVEIFSAVSEGDGDQLVRSGLSFIMTMASLGGPEGSLSSPMWSLFSSIFKMLFQSKEDGIPSKITKIVEGELQQFKFDSLKTRGAGVCGVLQVMFEELQHFHSEFRKKGTCGYRGLVPGRLDGVCELMSELKYFAEEKFHTLAGNFTSGSSEGETKCLTCLVAYCYIASMYGMVLSWNKILCLEMSATVADGVLADEAKTLLESTSMAGDQLTGAKEEAIALIESGNVVDAKLSGVKDEAKAILDSATKAELLESASMASAELTGVKDEAKALLESTNVMGGMKGEAKALVASATLASAKLDGMREDARALLEFLSDEEMLGPAGWWLGKLHVMELYRKAPMFFNPIERFRQVIGLPLTTYSITKASAALKKCTPSDRAQAGDKPQSPTIQNLCPLFSKPDAGDCFLNPNDANESDRHFCLVNSTRWPVCFFTSTTFIGEAKPYSDFLHCCSDFSKSNVHKVISGVLTVGESFKELGDMKNVQYIQFKSSSFGIATKLVPFYDSHLDLMIQRTDCAKSFIYNNRFCIVRGERKERKCGKLHRFFIEEFDTAKLKAQTVHY